MDNTEPIPNENANRGRTDATGSVAQRQISGLCPRCGYCPHCGRSNPYPYQIYYNVPNTIPYGGLITYGGSISDASGGLGEQGTGGLQ